MKVTWQQLKKYRASWKPVADGLRDFGGFTDEEIEAERLAILREVAGVDSSKDIPSQAAFDRVLQAHRQAAVLGLGPTSGNHVADQARKRLIYAIEQLGLADAYLDQIARDQFGADHWRSLPVPRLRHLSFTASARARSRSAASK